MTDTPPARILEVRSAERSFGAARALAAVDIEVAAGELLVLLGPSGCGKTTLLRAIAGLERLDAGTIALRGQPLARLPPERRGVALVFQDGGLFPHITVRDNVAIALRRQGLSWRQARNATAVQASLATVSMSAFADRKPHQLSGGQRQRVGIARALCADPILMLMDEPFASLDAELRVDLRRELRRLHLKRQIAETIFVTHDQTEALGIADRVAVMFDGTIVQHGTPTDLLLHPATLTVAKFVGVPRINVLPEYNRLILAVRPTDLTVDDRPDRLSATGTVTATELFAGGSLVALRLPTGIDLEVTITARTPAGIGEELTVAAHPEDVHCFDAQDGTRQSPAADALRATWSAAVGEPINVR